MSILSFNPKKSLKIRLLCFFQKISPNVTNHVFGKSIRKEFLSQYDVMRSSFIIVQPDDERKALAKYNSVISEQIFALTTRFQIISGICIQSSQRCSYFICDFASRQYMQSKNHRAYSIRNVNTHNMNQKYLRITTCTRFQPHLFLYRNQRHRVKNQCKDTRVI